MTCSGADQQWSVLIANPNGIGLVPGRASLQASVFDSTDFTFAGLNGTTVLAP